VGIGICYDGAFPEHSRALAMMGAELLIYPSAFAQGAEKHRYHTYFPIRALENTAYVAVSNLVGEAGGLTFFGEGTIYDPTGLVLAKAGSHEAVITAEVSRKRVDEVRRELPYLNELKVDFYHHSHG
jgi:predicted amidohydrolase